MSSEETDTSADSDAVTEKIPLIILETWHGVIQVSDGIVRAHGKFGFSNIERELNPSLNDILNSLAIIKGALTSISRRSMLEHGDQRLIDNTLQQILHMECISAALASDDQDAYDLHISRLESQPRI